MTEPTPLDPNNPKLQPLGPPEGLLEHLNLPPKAIKYLRRYQRQIWIGCVTVIVLSLAVAGYNAYRERQAQRAASALDAAILAVTENKAKLKQVIADFGSTESALWARVELASLAEEEGESGLAMKELESIQAELGSSTSLTPLLLSKRAVLYENDKQLDKALKLYTELVQWDTFAAEAYRAMGRVNEQLGKKKEAIAMYNKYLQSESGQQRSGQANPVREMVQSRLNQLQK
nr:tetratricopeptide repeat protein [uncultured Desulfobulbus sp.]